MAQGYYARAIKAPVHVIGPSVAYLPLTRGLYSLVDSFGIEEVCKYNWMAVHVPLRDTYIVKRRTGKVYVYIHRMLCDSGHKHVDHKNGNPLDNRKANLRPASSSENARNRGRTKLNKSGHKGVYWAKRYSRWVVCFRINGKTLHFGSYVIKDQAIAEARKRILEMHGEFARVA